MSARIALTMPDDGGRSTRRILKRFAKKLARDTLRLPSALFGVSLQRTAEEVRRLVLRYAEDRPRALYAVLLRCHVHVLLTCTLRALEDGHGEAAARRARAYLFQLLGELSLEGTLPSPVRWDGPPPLDALVSPIRRVYLPVDPATEAVIFEAGRVRLVEPSASRDVLLGQRASDRFVPVSEAIALSLVDHNPISDFEAHPDKEGNQLDLGEASAERWSASLSEGLDVVARWMPELRAEMRLLLQQFVPVGTDDEKHLSASYREAIGTVYLTLHPQTMTMVEAIIHEYQHNKINTLFHLDPVMDNAFWPLFRSPVRPDPRPLHGVLLAAHAFVPVAELYRRMLGADAPESRRESFMDRFRQIIEKNDDALAVLEEHAELSEAGAAVLADLGALHREHLALGL
ncbi:MAG: aKG-HExxH-type peptide beta-hydroxylase [Myxococcota bacterium]